MNLRISQLGLISAPDIFTLFEVSEKVGETFVSRKLEMSYFSDTFAQLNDDNVYTGINNFLNDVYVPAATEDAHAVNLGQALSLVALNKERYKADLLKARTGFYDPENIDVSYDKVNRTITLTGDLTSLYRNVLMTVDQPAFVDGWVSPAHPEGNGEQWLYYDGTNFIWSEIPDFTQLLIAVAYPEFEFAIRECHGFMHHLDHKLSHFSIGTILRSGADLGDFVLNSTTMADRRPTISQTRLLDEDLPCVLEALSTNSYTQLSLSGADATDITTDNDDIVPLSGSQPYYNQFVGGVWQQTLMSANEYQKLFVLAIPTATDDDSTKYRYVFVQGQSVGTLAEIKQITTGSINMGDFASIISEFVFVAEIIIRFTANNWSFTEVNKLTGSQKQQIGSPQGIYLSSVSSGDTLVGDGRASDILDINLNNANVWEAHQSVPNATEDGHALNRITGDGRYLRQNTRNTITSNTSTTESLLNLNATSNAGSNATLLSGHIDSNFHDRYFMQFEGSTGVNWAVSTDGVLREGSIPLGNIQNSDRLMVGTGSRKSYDFDNQDVNTILHTGIGRSHSDALNTPASSGIGMLFHLQHPTLDSYSFQMWNYLTDGRTYVRGRNGGDFQSWEKLAWESDLSAYYLASNPDNFITEPIGDGRYGRLAIANTWEENQTVPNATEDTHALNRITADGRYGRLDSLNTWNKSQYIYDGANYTDLRILRDYGDDTAGTFLASGSTDGIFRSILSIRRNEILQNSIELFEDRTLFIKPLSIPAATVGSHALNRITADGRYLRQNTRNTITSNTSTTESLLHLNATSNAGTNATLLSGYIASNTTDRYFMQFEGSTGVNWAVSTDGILREGSIPLENILNTDRLMIGTGSRKSYNFDNQDVNTILHTGIGRSHSDAPNTPASSGIGMLFNLQHPDLDSYSFQMWNYLTDGRTYVRGRNGGSFQSWEKLAWESDLSAYVPTSRTLTINGTALNLGANRSWDVGTVTSVSGGNGLTGSVTGSGSLTLGTPSSITTTSTNSVTATSHTHAITGFYPSSNPDNFINFTDGDGRYGRLGSSNTWQEPQTFEKEAIFENKISVTTTTDSATSGWIKIAESNSLGDFNTFSFKITVMPARSNPDTPHAHAEIYATIRVQFGVPNVAITNFGNGISCKIIRVTDGSTYGKFEVYLSQEASDYRVRYLVTSLFGTLNVLSTGIHQNDEPIGDLDNWKDTDQSRQININGDKIITEPTGDGRYGRLAIANTWEENQTVPNATADGHALNRITADGRYEKPLTFSTGLSRSLNTITTNDSEINHDNLLNYTSDRHFLMGDISITESQISDLKDYYLASNPSNFINFTDGDGRYLKLTGGTLTGKLTVDNPNYNSHIGISRTSGGLTYDLGITISTLSGAMFISNENVDNYVFDKNLIIPNATEGSHALNRVTGDGRYGRLGSSNNWTQANTYQSGIKLLNVSGTSNVIELNDNSHMISEHESYLTLYPNRTDFVGGLRIRSHKDRNSYRTDFEINSARLSMRFGDSAIASDAQCIALGSFSEATNTGAVAIGLYAKASGVASLAIGSQAQASGEKSTAIGDLAQASGESSVALNKGKASGDDSFAAGLLCEAFGQDSVAFGRENLASGSASVALGYNNVSSGFTAFTMGRANTADNQSSFAMGTGNIASGIYSFALGRGARAISESAFAIDLDNTKTEVGLKQFRISGAAGIGGNLGWQNYSDRRLKKDIKLIDEENNLGKILRLNSVRFKWKDGTNENLNLGFIAQDVEDIVPESVRYDAINDIYSMEYTALIPVLVEAVKEQQVTINKLKEHIKQ